MNNLHFEVAFSYCYENMMYKFFARLDKLVSFLLLFSAIGVVSNVSNWLSGTVIAALTAFQFVYQPASRAQQAKTQAKFYLQQFRKRESVSDDDLRSVLDRGTAADSDTVDLLHHPARLAALALLGYPSNNCFRDIDRQRQMTFFERLAVRFAGDWPEFQV